MKSFPKDWDNNNNNKTIFFLSFVCLFISFSVGGVQWTVFTAASTKPVLSLIQSVDCFRTIWNRTRPRALVQNQHTMELISARKMSHKNKQQRPEDVPLVESMHLVLTRMPCESYRRRLRSLLLCLCGVFRALINSLVCRLLLNKVLIVPVIIIYSDRWAPGASSSTRLSSKPKRVRADVSWTMVNAVSARSRPLFYFSI